MMLRQNTLKISRIMRLRCKYDNEVQPVPGVAKIAEPVKSESSSYNLHNCFYCVYGSKDMPSKNQKNVTFLLKKAKKCLFRCAK